MTFPSSSKKVVVLALPGAQELDLASVLDVFTQANWQCRFASSDVMTRRFRFHLKVKPLDYRARFRSSIGPGKALRKGHPATKGSPKIPGWRQQGDVAYRSNDRVSPE